ncbi:glycine betaine/L-proline ABC transporter ATP-binding protein [Paenactinomyces guangxiensis]|uniref:Quaternary amine transport ATP-binding protein n=1 Tax=Paenactinomyces guangxiensis TaxID=1490290 RepID=A0A7W1WSK9_9BACL|nr:glycine betaine/L-proline ABC transporter ATP-binding protein [Paenactinomyces guangxiensis]MBA4495262.1 glycine betaine/L-proline ABC transporter ATP-binding protein [Paenactinomyces guangxiensis]MBH8592346.1 glycine betaine/L-proline ABC transporter ATP-binding protein [Paenactinomyces guangxiensis]
MNKLKVKNLTKVFGRTPKRGIKLLRQGKSKDEIFKETGLTVGVNQASFHVKSGEIFVIMGLSGSGKSTLLRMLNRLIEPTEGEILLGGEDQENITTMSKAELRNMRRERMGMVFQKFALFPHRTVLENVEYGLEIQGVDKKLRREQALKSLELVGLGDWAETMPDQLSGGMQQRVGIARALANSPDILLMDEAFGALDPLIRKDMQDELLELQRTMKKTIIFITHDLDEALRIGDRIALMKDGSIVQTGTPEEILTRPANEYVERFTEDVNLTRVLTAEAIMRKGETIIIDKDGPAVALKKMREKGVPTLIVIDRDKQFKGLITAEGARTATRSGKTLEEVLIPDAIRVDKDMLLSDLLPLMAEQDFIFPAAVIDKSGKYVGMVGRGAIFAALAGNGGDLS